MKADFKRFLNLHTLQGKMFVIILAVALLVMALSLTLCCYLCVDAVEELTAGYMINYIQFADETLSEKLDNAIMTSLAVTADQEIVQETIQSSAALASYRWFQQYKPTVSLLNGVIEVFCSYNTEDRHHKLCCNQRMFLRALKCDTSDVVRNCHADHAKQCLRISSDTFSVQLSVFEDDCRESILLFL